MKKYFFVLLLLLFTSIAFCQNTITTGNGSVLINGVVYGTNDIGYIADRPTGTLDIRNKAFGYRIFYAAANKITNGSTGNAFTDIDAVVAYLVTGNIGFIPVGSGGGGGGTVGGALEATQLLVKGYLQSIDGKTPALGQAAMASSMPVVLASNHTPINVIGSFYQTTQPVSLASLPLPSGAATSANQGPANASLSSIDGKIPSLNGDGGVPVHIQNLNIDPSTGTKQATQITVQQAIQTNTANIPTKGSNILANSMPVGIATDQILIANPQSLFQLTTSSAQNSNDIFYTGPVGNAKVLYCQFGNTTSGTVVIQFSNDNVNWVNGLTQNLVTNAQGQSMSVAPATIYKLPIFGAYCRIMVSTGLGASSSMSLWGSYVERTSEVYTPTVNIAAGVTQIGSVFYTPSASTGGFTLYHKLISAATTNSTLIKNSGTIVNAIIVSNTSAAVKFLKLFNLASAPVVGTAVPTYTIMIPAGTTLSLNVTSLRFNLGMSYCMTGLAPDTDTTAVAAGDLILNINYL